MSGAARRAVVTGGASGLGAALCRALVARGDEVISGDVQDPLETVDGVAFGGAGFTLVIAQRAHTPP